jgi:hypothetical protein
MLAFGLAPGWAPADNLPGARIESPAPEEDGIRSRRSNAAAGVAASTLGNVIVIPPASFVPDGLAPDTHFTSFTDGHIQGTDRYGCLLAPVILPPGASSLDRVLVFVHDDNSSESVTFSVRRVSLKKGSSSRLGSVETQDSAGPVKYEIPLKSSSVSNSFAFQITTCLNSPDIFLYGARVHFH